MCWTKVKTEFEVNWTDSENHLKELEKLAKNVSPIANFLALDLQTIEHSPTAGVTWHNIKQGDSEK